MAVMSWKLMENDLWNIFGRPPSPLLDPTPQQFSIQNGFGRQADENCVDLIALDLRSCRFSSFVHAAFAIPAVRGGKETQS